MFTYPTLKIVVLKSDVNKDGLTSIYLQYIQNKKVNRISLRKRIPMNSWTGTAPKYIAEKGTYKHPNAKALNALINKKLAHANEIIIKAELENRPINFPNFKRLFSGSKQHHDFYHYYDQFIEIKKIEVSSSTIRQINVFRRKLKEFAPSLYLNQIDRRWIETYEKYLVEEKKNSRITIARELQLIRSVIDLAIKDDDNAQNPFNKFHIKSGKTKSRSPITINQVKTLFEFYQEEQLSKRKKEVLRAFLFSCYVGMDSGDLKSLDRSNIKLIGEKYIIEFKRKKTGVSYLVPLSENAISLIDLERSGLMFDLKWKNQSNVNSILKNLFVLAEIDRPDISFHIARHTFGTLSINAGIPREIVRKMMGHSSNEMTDHYAKLNSTTIINTAIGAWENQLNQLTT